MKKLLSLALIMSILSCRDTSFLEKKIKDLESENKQLKEISKKSIEDELVSSELILMPNALYFEKGKKNTITAYFISNRYIPLSTFILLMKTLHRVAR